MILANLTWIPFVALWAVLAIIAWAFVAGGSK